MRSRVIIPNPQQGGLSIQPFDPLIHSQYASVLERLDADDGRFAVVITNESPKGVDCVAIRWTITAAHGTKVRNQIVDGYFEPTPVIPPGARILVTPAERFPETVPERFASVRADIDRAL